MPKLHVIRSEKVKKIPYNNPFEYTKVVDPIYKIHKVSRMELTTLPCRSSHKIKPHSMRAQEYDNLYEIFTKFTDQNIEFIRQWLKTFMLANHHNFETRASKYLASKVLSFDNWTNSVNDGCKGDVLALYGLCMLFEKQAVVHLKNGLIWTTLEELSDHHSDDLLKCNIHLCYLG